MPPETKSEAQVRIERFRRARRDKTMTVLEGFHALKHAVRFGADVVEAVATDVDAVRALGESLAPDVASDLLERVTPISDTVFARLAPQAPRTGVMAIAQRPAINLPGIMEDAQLAPVVLLEDPRNMGNMGACVRVAAGADAAAVLTTGDNDPWHPDAVRGAAGLHYALPVAHIDNLPESDRPLLAIDPEGGVMNPMQLPPRSILAFGTERYGLSDKLLAKADERLQIPMKAGVSSLNLATSVAAVLFAWRLCRTQRLGDSAPDGSGGKSGTMPR